MNTDMNNEIFPGMTVEEITALFFNADALKEPPYRVYQLNSDGHRYYYRFNQDGEPEFYPSVTTLLKQVMPTPPALLDWMIANGKESGAEKRDLAAAYGTFMHAQFESLIINRRYDFDDVPTILSEYMEQNNIPDKVFSEWAVKIRKDVLAFAQFVRDYNVKPLAIEIGLVHPQYNYAGCVDMPCYMTDPKTGETFTAIVDFKSGRKGFFEEHELQLHLYRMMWNVNFPDVLVTRLFNFAPKDWRLKPTYNLKDQTDSVNAKKIPHLLNLAAIEDEKRDNTITVVRGQLDLDSGKIMDNVLNLSLAELIKIKRDKNDTPEQAANAPESKDSDNAPDSAPNKAVRATKSLRPTNPRQTKENRIQGKNAEKLTAYDVCDKYCTEKNCDFCLGEHGEPCLDAIYRSGYKEENNPASEPTPEQIAEQTAKDNLLNTEIEL